MEGTSAGDPGELLWDGRMEGVLRAMGRVFDVIILSLPPVGKSAGGLALAARTDGYLLAVEENKHRRAALKEAVAKLRLSGGKIVGVIYLHKSPKTR